MIPLQYIFDSLRRHPKWVAFFEKWYIRFPFFESPLLMEVVVCVQGLFSLIFVIFCLILFYDQLKNIWYDSTYIEQTMEGVEAKPRWTDTFYQSACEAMGEPFCMNWFLPIEGKEMKGSMDNLSHIMLLDEHDKTE